MTTKTQNILARFVTPILLASAAMAQLPSLNSRYTFVKVEYPGAFVSYPLGINDHREMVGSFVDLTGLHGFLFKGGVFTKIDYPGSEGRSSVGGINNRGDMVGVYIDAKGFQHGFLRARPAGCDGDREDENNASCKVVFTSIDDPNAVQTTGIPFEFGPGLGTASVGINNAGAISGMFATAALYSDGFILSHGKYKSVDYPNETHFPSLGTKLFAINDQGVAAGDYYTFDPATMKYPLVHGFLYENGRFTLIDAPGSGGFGTQVNGVNNFRAAVGLFSNDAYQFHGMVWFLGNFFTLDYPGEPFSELHAINNRGDITGAYTLDGTDPNAPLHGFVAYPKEF